jgi:outer membrane protein TolC
LKWILWKPVPPTAVLLLLAALTGCAAAGPRLEGGPPTSAAPGEAWVPPPSRRPSPPPSAPAGELPAIRPDWTLADIVAAALANNPDTRAAWADAKAASARYGSERGAFFPTVSAEGAYDRGETLATRGSSAGTYRTYGAYASLSYLLLDFGGRTATAEKARQDLLAADWTHNAVLQDTALQVELAYFRYMAAKALLEAQKTNLSQAKAGLDTAQGLHEAGLATLADVLQAKTRLSQVRLAMDTLEGEVHTTRGALAVAMGFPATTPYDLEPVAGEIPADAVFKDVEALVTVALEGRPDLEASRAEARAAEARVREKRAARLPSLNLFGTGGRTWFDATGRWGDSWAAGLQLRVPVFSGGSLLYDQREAEARVEAARARQKSLEDRVIFQVFSSYYGLRTATQKVETTGALRADATQSEAVALGRYQEGVGTILELLTAQSALALARAEYIMARLEWFSALAQLARDAGLIGPRGEASAVMAGTPTSGNHPPESGGTLPSPTETP